MILETISEAVFFYRIKSLLCASARKFSEKVIKFPISLHSPISIVQNDRRPTGNKAAGGLTLGTSIAGRAKIAAVEINALWCKTRHAKGINCICKGHANNIGYLNLTAACSTIVREERRRQGFIGFVNKMVPPEI